MAGSPECLQWLLNLFTSSHWCLIPLYFGFSILSGANKNASLVGLLS